MLNTNLKKKILSLGHVGCCPLVTFGFEDEKLRFIIHLYSD